MHHVNNVSRYPMLCRDIRLNKEEDITNGNNLQWALPQPRLATPPRKRLAVEIPSNSKPGAYQFGKTHSMEIFPSPAVLPSVYRCHSLPIERYHTVGNIVGTATTKTQMDEVKRKVVRNEHYTSHSNGEYATVLARRSKGGDVRASTSAQSAVLSDARKVLHSVDSSITQPAFCPNILHMCISTPTFLQPGKFNFRRLNSPTFGSQGGEMESLRWHISNSLKRHGVCVINRFMGIQSAEFLSHEVKSLYNDRTCTNGLSMGKNAGGKPVREDLVTWLDGTEPQYPNIRTLCEKLDNVVGCGTGVTENYSICGSTKAMVARYMGKGAGYRLHVDNPSQDGRCLTCIYYVNKGWNSERMGGNLKLYAKTSGKTAEIQPIFDRVVFFYSDTRNPHEVLPAYEDRYAVTVWYFDLSQRAKAIERLKATRTRS